MASQIRFSWSLQLWFPNGLCLTTLPFWWPVYIKTWWIISFSNKISSRHGYTDSSVREFNTKWRTFSFGVQTVQIILKIPFCDMMPVKNCPRQYVLVSPILSIAWLWLWQDMRMTNFWYNIRQISREPTGRAGGGHDMKKVRNWRLTN